MTQKKEQVSAPTSYHIADFAKRVNPPRGEGELPDEQEKYDAMYACLSPELLEFSHEPAAMGSAHMQHWPRFANSPVLVAGCGSGVGLRKLDEWGFDAYGCDISRACQKLAPDEKKFACCPLHKMPYKAKTFSTTICCDVLEHIPPDYVDLSLAELFRVTQHCMIISIGLVDSTIIHGMHLSVHPMQWWAGKLSRYGFTYLSGQSDDEKTAVFVMDLYAEPKEEGK